MRAATPGLCLLWALGAAHAAVPQLMTVDLGLKAPADYPTRIAAQVCSGLFNRDPTVAGPAYTLMEDRDPKWLHDCEGISDPVLTPATDFVAKCMGTVAKGYIRYNASTQKAVVPNIITLAGVLDAVPLEDGSPLAANATLVFDAVHTFAGFSELEGTEWVFDRYGNRTTTLAKMDPGYDHSKPWSTKPPLTGTANPGLIDFIVKERLFNFFLTDGCVPLTKEHALMEKMATSGTWPSPIAVYGYDDTFPVAGDLFEAETGCVKEHNMGQIASDGCGNLGFFSRKPKITEPLQQLPVPPRAAYNASQTYLSIILGDGDSLKKMKRDRRDWMLERVQRCNANSSAPAAKRCFPLLWSISPHLLNIAPDWLRWYYDQARSAGADWFVMPPSGALYAYPSEMRPADQARFVEQTEAAARLLNTSATVAWEFMGTWEKAIKDYFPRYGAQGVINALFAVNVPYMIPVVPFGFKEQYKLLGDKKNVVLFRPREWRGGNGKGAQELNATAMAKSISSERGAVSHLYVTSDGGANLDLVYDMVAQLEEHVNVVDHQTLAAMALQRG